MKRNLLLHILVAILTTVTISGCAGVTNSFKTQTLNDMYPILSNEEYKEFNSLETNEEITESLENFWQNIDSTSNISPREFRTEYEKRLNYANIHYPDRPGWGRSERKRIYLLYGPPAYIEKNDFINIPISKFSEIKALEIWYYMTPGINNSLPSQVDKIFPGEKKFMFADMIGSGFYEAIYSTEEIESIDSRLFNSNY